VVAFKMIMKLLQKALKDVKCLIKVDKKNHGLETSLYQKL